MFSVERLLGAFLLADFPHSAPIKILFQFSSKWSLLSFLRMIGSWLIVFFLLDFIVTQVTLLLLRLPYYCCVCYHLSLFVSALYYSGWRSTIASSASALLWCLFPGTVLFKKGWWLADFWLTTMTKCAVGRAAGEEKGWWLGDFWLTTMTKCTVGWAVGREKGGVDWPIFGFPP
jgi:hypothetical protein